MVVVTRRGGHGCLGSEGAAVDDGCDERLYGFVLPSTGIDWPVGSFVGCDIDGVVAGCDFALSLRFKSGTARTGSGAFEADALGVLFVSSSGSNGGVVALASCFFCTFSLDVAGSGVSALGSGGAKERGSAQLREERR